MKNGLFGGFIFSFLLMTACSKKETANADIVQDLKAHYDTAAIDSFSAGATSIDVVRQIRMSSQKYQDSLKEAARLEQEEKRIKEELEKENKKKQEEEKKKPEEKKTTESSTPDNIKTE
ncbi:regulator of replication initiation timing [Chryseobacterium defluvii]|uniref:Regulator of replication initiation timing n=1 Tax=Chryseobacterium defluvii TaxID=160396 RepID=A0A840KKG3_9FLAO|nr:hypothetical protein [Chryseobacterium defluvii]MBB4807352.1 regulator of replication initiation timing [Chryseobacterium defluvii]